MKKENLLDPVTYLFSAYLNTVQTNVKDRVAEIYGTQITPVEIQYEGVDVSFQHQTWRIRENSICSNVSHRLDAFSQCTVKASELFTTLCAELSKIPDQTRRHGKFRRMYCNASISFKPTIAAVRVGSDESELQKAKQACNAATVVAMGSREPKFLKEKRMLCDAYRELKLRN